MPPDPAPTWRYTTEPLSEKMIRTAERALGVAFPADYRECVRENHGGAIPDATFPVPGGPTGQEAKNVSLLLTLDPRESENVVQTRSELGAQLPEGIIPIINDGSSNFVGLDYRDDASRSAPTIVFWRQDASGDDAVVSLAPNFSAFLSTVKSA